MTEKLNRSLAFGPLSRVAYFATTVCIVVGLVACGSGSPTGLADTPMIFTGTLAYQQVENINFRLDDDEIIRVDIVELAAVLVDITNNPTFVATIGFGLGTPLDDACITRQRLAAQEGGFFTYGLNAGDYCMQLSDTGFLPEDSVVKYTLSISSSA